MTEQSEIDYEEAASGSVFMVQTTVPYGDPLKHMQLRMMIQATVVCTVGEMMAAIVADGVFVGDHILPDRALTTQEETVIYRREPVAIHGDKIVYLKPFLGRFTDRTSALRRGTGMTSHQVSRGLA